MNCFINEIESILIKMPYNIDNKITIMDNLSRLQILIKEIKYKDIYSKMDSLIKKIYSYVYQENIEKTKIEALFHSFSALLYEFSKKDLENFQINLSKTNIEHFQIMNHDGNDLVIAGSFDFSYYHEVELFFLGVEFIMCPNYFCANEFIIASDNEKKSLEKYLYMYANDGITFCISDADTKEKYYIVSRRFCQNWGMVYYYDRKDLKPGERIAEWILKRDTDNR